MVGHLSSNSLVLLSFGTVIAAKHGQNPLLAVATEEGSVHLIDASKRKEWDYGAIPTFSGDDGNCL